MRGIGMIMPEKNSPVVEIISIEPTGDMVINTDMYISMDIDTTTIRPRSREMMKRKNDIALGGNVIL